MYELAPIRPVPPMMRDMDLRKNRQASTTSLAGDEIRLDYDDGVLVTLRLTADRVQWEISEADETSSGEAPYDAVELRPGVFFLHFADAERTLGLSHVIDRDRGRAVTAWDRLINDQPTMRRLIRTARIVGASTDYEPIAETRELIGKRAYCEYSEEAALEHVYVNSRAILWQWLRLPDDDRFDPLRTEIGIEAVSMRKVRDDLFLLALHDGGTFELTLLMDFAQGRNVGMLFGELRNQIVSRPVGARIVSLDHLSYPQEYQPG
jgi:hypothetical protein